MAIPFHLVQSESGASLTAKINGEIHSASDTHPNWSLLVESVTKAGADTDLDALVGLFDPAVRVQTFFDKVSERVSVSGGHVYFDGEEVNDGLADHILRFINEGNDAGPYINFLENIMTNPNEHSREQLFDWLSRFDFAITAEGHFLAYKGVAPFGAGYKTADLTDEQQAKYPYESISTGRAIVDGTVYEGAIPNGVGAVVEMPRGDVAHDPRVGCHTGLHAGTFEYASDFSRGTVLTVQINPRDVVSVPTDCDWQKIRTCRYTVKEVNEGRIDTAFVGVDEDFSDDAPFEGSEEESYEAAQQEANGPVVGYFGF